MNSSSYSLVILLIYFTLECSGDSIASKVGRNLLNLLGQGGQQTEFDVLVTFNESTEPLMNKISTRTFTSRAQKALSLTNLLESQADFNQQSVRQLLLTDKVPFQVLWISNQLHIPKANASLINYLVSNFPEILQISDNPVFQLFDTNLQPKVIKRQQTHDAWGVKVIKSYAAQSLLNSVNTSAVVVGIIDSGVRVSHEALRDSYYGTYGWFDPYPRPSPVPNDGSGHGTHVTGTILGKFGIGVYPDAKWMACRGCNGDTCTESALLACGQFMTCPTLPDGSSKDCSKAPQVVSNSWGGPGGHAFYDSVIRAWHAVGIVPVFAIGNAGPDCSTVSSPGDRDVIGVGSVSADKTVSRFSSRGPTVRGGIKPDISAPGSQIPSAWHTSDDRYAVLQGTSMACPHVAGVVAMMLAYNPNLTYNQIRDSLISGADKEPSRLTNVSCGGINETQFPNHLFGHGRLDALESLRIAMGQPNTQSASPSLFSASPQYAILWWLFLVANF